MKIALYIEDGSEQIVLTLETPTEREILNKLNLGKRELHIYSGEFYSCKGGWTRWRQSVDYHRSFHLQQERDQSTIIVLNEPKPEPEQKLADPGLANTNV